MYLLPHCLPRQFLRSTSFFLHFFCSIGSVGNWNIASMYLNCYSLNDNSCYSKIITYKYSSCTLFRTKTTNSIARWKFTPIRQQTFLCGIFWNLKNQNPLNGSRYYLDKQDYALNNFNLLRSTKIRETNEEWVS